MKNRTWLILTITIVFSLTYSACNKNDTIEYLGNWTKKAPMSNGRYGAVGFTIGVNGYLGLGYNPSKQKDRLLKDFWEYHGGQENFWTVVDTTQGSFPGHPRYWGVAFSIGQKGYVGTGFDIDQKYYKDFYEFDPSAAGNKWKKIADYPGPERYGAIAFSINGKGYVGCGISDGNENNDFYEYDPFTNTWKIIEGFGGPAQYFGASFVINNKAYVVTGLDGKTNVDDFWVFNGDSGVWRPLNFISNRNESLSYDDDYTDIVRNGGVGMSANGKGYIACGDGGNAKVWEYTPETDQWKRKTSIESLMSTRLYPVSFSTSDNRMFVATGLSGSYVLNDLWEFKPNDLFSYYQ